MFGIADDEMDRFAPIALQAPEDDDQDEQRRRSGIFGMARPIPFSAAQGASEAAAGAQNMASGTASIFGVNPSLVPRPQTPSTDQSIYVPGTDSDDPTHPVLKSRAQHDVVRGLQSTGDDLARTFPWAGSPQNTSTASAPANDPNAIPPLRVPAGMTSAEGTDTTATPPHLSPFNKFRDIMAQASGLPVGTQPPNSSQPATAPGTAPGTTIPKLKPVPELHGFKKFADVLGQWQVPALERAIPGTPGYVEKENAKTLANAAQEAGIQDTQQQTQQRAEQARKAGADADRIANQPKLLPGEENVRTNGQTGEREQRYEYPDGSTQWVPEGQSPVRQTQPTAGAPAAPPQRGNAPTQPVENSILPPAATRTNQTPQYTYGKPPVVAPGNEPVTPETVGDFTQRLHALGLDPVSEATFSHVPQGTTAAQLEKRYADAAALKGMNQKDRENTIRDQERKDAIAQSAANRNTAFRQEIEKQARTEINKTWTDPMRGYTQVAAQAEFTKRAIQQGADGAGLMTSMAPTMEVLGVNNFAQTHRISPAEAAAAGAPGGWSERFNAWATKAGKGKISAQVAAEGQQLMDDLTDAAHHKAIANTRFIVANSNGALNEDTTAVLDRDGNPSTLAHQLQVMQQPAGATGKAKGSDGKLHWTDGKKDLGLAQ